MVAQVLFWAGIAMSVITVGLSWQGHGDDKRAATAFPFMLLIGAAVAKYLGVM